MAQDDGDELAALRRRAYGPDADIAADADAVARLRELEAAHAPLPPATRPPAPVGRAARGGPPRIVVVPPRPPLPAPPARGLRRLARRPSRRAVAVLWAASVVVAAGLAASVTAAGILSATGYDVTLRPLAEPPETNAAALFGLSGAVTGYDDLAGIRAVTAEPHDNVCLVVQARPEAVSPDEVAGTCAPPGLLVTVELIVRRTYPEEVLARYRPGTTLRFTFDGEVVGVDVVEPAVVPDA
jgi:hypothetical protein